MIIKKIRLEFVCNLIGEFNQQKHTEVLKKMSVQNNHNLKISQLEICSPSKSHLVFLNKVLHQIDQLQQSLDLGLKMSINTLQIKTKMLTSIPKKKLDTV